MAGALGAFGTIVGAVQVVAREVVWWLSAGLGLLRAHPGRTLLWSVLAVVWRCGSGGG